MRSLFVRFVSLFSRTLLLDPGALRSLAVAICLVFTRSLNAQDHTVLFSVSDPGLNLSMTNWGLDTCWPSPDNMRRGIIFMGATNVNIVRVGFVVDAPLVNNDISASQKATLQNMANIAAMAGSNARWDMNLASGVDAWYQSGANLVYPDRWAAAIDACRRYYNKSFWSVEGFNEPDYLVNNEGSPQNLYDIFGLLKGKAGFSGTLMAGGSTLNNDQALNWWNGISARANIGTTHCLAGNASTYVDFLKAVSAGGKMPFNPELHNVMEAIMGANYGLKGGIWWGTAELARGEFVKASQGRRLGYAEDLGKWTAAAVYRAPSGNIQAFAGASERMAATTVYRFFSKDRDVFYDGHGPQRDYVLTVQGGSGYMTTDQRNVERVINIAWGEDVQPAIGGRYIIVNRKSGLALEVPGASSGNGTQLRQATYTGGANQKWDAYQIPFNLGWGDYSYYSIVATHDGVTMDLNNWSYANGEKIQQWNGGTNMLEQWYFEYTGDGYFKMKSRWSGKCARVSGGSTASGALIVQWDDIESLDEQWRLIPAVVSNYDFQPPSAPSRVVAVANGVSIALNWDGVGDSDLANYTVLRSTNSGGPYEIVARSLTSTSFTDKSANQPLAYYYVVRATDRSLNTSSNSLEASATPTGARSLIARYTFNGNGADSSVNANHATLIGAPAFVAGKFGSAMDLNGTTQYAMGPAGLMAGVTNFTIAMWVNWDGGGAWQRLFDFGNNTTEYMFLTPSSGSGTLRFAATMNGAASEQIVETSPLIVGQWVHVAVTRNGNTVRLYTNGNLSSSGTVTIGPSRFNPAINYFGDSQYEADPLFNGRIDEVFIYNYALNPSEIVALSSNHPPIVASRIAALVSGGAIQFSWPNEALGSKLEFNVVGVGSLSDWTTVSGSTSTTNTSVQIDYSGSNAFFRLAQP